MRFGIIQEVQDSICGGSFLKLPSSGTVQQVTSSRWIHWHLALHARDAILVDMDWTHHASSVESNPDKEPQRDVLSGLDTCLTMRVLHGRCICKFGTCK